MLSPRKESTKSCEIMADASAPRSASDCELPTFNTSPLSPISLSQMITRASKQSETLEREKKERDGNLNEELGEVPLFTLPGSTQSLWTNNVTYYYYELHNQLAYEVAF
jgi:hypothetical protein